MRDRKAFVDSARNLENFGFGIESISIFTGWASPDARPSSREGKSHIEDREAAGVDAFQSRARLKSIDF